MELHEQGQSIISLSQEYNVHVNMLYKWRSEYRNPDRPSFTGNGNAALTDQEKELFLLKKELEQVKMEREILKKAISIFSENDGKSIN